MTIAVKAIQPAGLKTWDEYVSAHPQSTLYHLAGWKNVIKKTYGHKTYYLIAESSSKPTANSYAGPVQCASDPAGELDSTHIVGILPLIHLRHLIFGNSLISMPYFDMGGIVADDEKAEKALLNKALKLAKKIGADSIELRNHQRSASKNTSANPINCSTQSNKVRMLLELPESSATLMESFKSKLRSQIRKPVKEGLKSKIGGLELLDDFYEVFSVNMRDLGSPVHTKRLMQNVLKGFSDRARLVMIYRDNRPLAGSVIVGFRDILENPWASALKQYRRFSPNMLLYWTMLEYACDRGFKYFDFGRSTPGEGTYKFKEQWGAKPQPLFWQFIALNGSAPDTAISEKPSFALAARLWQKLPVPVTTFLGPKIRKYIGL